MKVDVLIRESLKEDIGKGDITTEFLFEENFNIVAELVSKEKGILCGINIFKRVFQILSPEFKFKFFYKDGDEINRGDVICKIKGPLKEFLSGERVALNFLQHLSGISTLTREFVKKADGKFEVFDTRKTTPLLRELEKYAVKVGGGKNHRMGLYDMVLIKDNHISAFMKRYNLGKERAIFEVTKKAKQKSKNIKVEVEVKNFSEAKSAFLAGADIIMFDNAEISELKKFNNFLKDEKRKVIIEFSGNVNINSLKKIKGLNIDRVSVGMITHSAPSLDFSLRIVDILK